MQEHKSGSRCLQNGYMWGMSETFPANSNSSDAWNESLRVLKARYSPYCNAAVCNMLTAAAPLLRSQQSTEADTHGKKVTTTRSVKPSPRKVNVNKTDLSTTLYNYWMPESSEIDKNWKSVVEFDIKGKHTTPCESYQNYKLDVESSTCNYSVGLRSLPPNITPGKPLTTKNCLQTQDYPGMIGNTMPHACGARQLSKLKRFLNTLIQFGGDINPEVKQNVRQLVLNLVNSTITIEDFHSKLQEVTNFPLRPFVIPFLKANLPLLQRELIYCAQMAKKTPSQFLADNEQLFLKHNYGNNINSGFFFTRDQSQKNGDKIKRKRTTDSSDSYEDAAIDAPDTKRQACGSPKQDSSTSPQGASSSSTTPLNLSHTTNRSRKRTHDGLLDTPFLPFSGGNFAYRPSSTGPGITRSESGKDQFVKSHQEEWHNIESMLTAILELVEKTRKACNIMQAKSSACNIMQAKSSTCNSYPAPVSISEDINSSDDKYLRNSDQLDDIIAEIRRQAQLEIQKAVSIAEEHAAELLALEKIKMDRLLLQIQEDAKDSALSMSTKQMMDPENCWNCGRAATETCSGCNKARYCGSFCQHKDWDRHQSKCREKEDEVEEIALPPEDSTKKEDNIL